MTATRALLAAVVIMQVMILVTITFIDWWTR